MTADPWALLREARDTLDSEASTPEELDFVARIEAALAQRQDGIGTWTQCTSVSNECLGGCRSMREHDSYRHAQLQRERDEARAALAERQHSATDDVDAEPAEWREGESIPSTGCPQWHADITKDVCVNVWLTSPPLSEYAWEVVYNSGDSKKTLAEAKAAAMSAARGMR